MKPLFSLAVLLMFGLAATAGQTHGYKLYYGTSSGVYDTSVDVGDVIQYTVTGLANGTYYFVTTYYDGNGLESGYSNEVSGTVTSGSETLAWDRSTDDPEFVVGASRIRIIR